MTTRGCKSRRLTRTSKSAHHKEERNRASPAVRLPENVPESMRLQPDAASPIRQRIIVAVREELDRLPTAYIVDILPVLARFAGMHQAESRVPPLPIEDVA